MEHSLFSKILGYVTQIKWVDRNSGKNFSIYLFIKHARITLIVTGHILHKKGAASLLSSRTPARFTVSRRPKPI
jgi:hypothetical protein